MYDNSMMYSHHVSKNNFNDQLTSENTKFKACFACDFIEPLEIMKVNN